MASGDDPLADMQNLIGYQGLVGNNPYSPFQGQIPFYGGAGPGVGYINGWPTDAQGNPIQAPAGMQIGAPNQAPPTAPSAPGTTLNSNPVNNALMQQAQAGVIAQGESGLPGGQTVPGTQGSGQLLNALIQQGQNAGAAAQPQGGGGSPMVSPAASPSANNAGLTRQQYLQLLANPGPLPTYGAAGPQAGQTATGSPPPNVLASFLAANQGRNTPFLNTLRGLQTQPGGTS